jgi:hypothetical protein
LWLNLRQHYVTYCLSSPLRRTTTFILNLSIWKRDNFTPRPIYPRKITPPQKWSGRFGEEKNRLSLPGFEPRIVQPRRYTDYATPAPYHMALSLTRAVERRLVGWLMNCNGSAWTQLWPNRDSSRNLLGGIHENQEYYHDNRRPG